MTPARQIDGLEIKLRQLAAKVERQRAHSETVVAENLKLKRELDHQLGVVNALKDKLERSQQPASAGGTGVDSPASRETIAYCLKEIDRCLDWLQRN